MKKSLWILRKLKRVDEVAAEPPKRECVSGETYHYLGRRYRLKVIEDPDVIPFDIGLKQGRFMVRVPSVSDDRARRRSLNRALIWWCMQKAEERLKERVEIYAPKVGSKPKEVIVKDQMKRWGSCTKDGPLNLNY